MIKHTYDTVITVSDTFKVNVSLILDDTGDVIDWHVFDMAGINISEDVCHLFMKDRNGKFTGLDVILTERAIDKMRDED